MATPDIVKGAYVDILMGDGAVSLYPSHHAGATRRH